MPDEPVSPWARGYFDEQSRLGKEYGSRPRGALRPPRPARGVPDAITNALLGIQAGIQGSQDVNRFGSPLLSALAGASAAASAPRAQDIQAQREAALAQARVQALDAVPVDEVSPGLVERFPELQGLPLGAVNKLAPMLQRQEQLEQTLAMLAIREEGADRRAGTRQDAREDTELLRQEGGLRDDFAAQTKDYRIVRDAYKRIRSVGSAASAAGDMALLVGYMKLIDPSTGVKEGEYATAANAGSIDERIRARYNELVNGAKLTPEQRTDFLTQADAQFGSHYDTYQQVAQQYQDLAGRIKARPENVVLDPTGGFPDRVRRRGAASDGTVQMQTPDGKIWNVPESKAKQAEARGAKRL